MAVQHTDGQVMEYKFIVTNGQNHAMERNKGSSDSVYWRVLGIIWMALGVGESCPERLALELSHVGVT